jgi:hypothetical protein
MRLNYLVATCAAPLFMVLASPVFADQVAVAGTTDQQLQVQASLDAYPALKADLQKAAASGLFSDIRIVPRGEVRASGPFEAAVCGREIILTPEWLASQKVPYFDVRTKGEILPDNLCVGLGHLAEHIINPMPGPKSTSDFMGWLHAKLTSEARAFLVGWGYVHEAALAKMHGNPLTGRQVG